MSQISSQRILQLMVGGAFGGLVSFLVLNPKTVREELEGSTGGIGEGLLQAFGSSLELGMVVGLAIGACLVATEELPTGRPARILLRTLLGAVAGACFGAIGGLFGQFAFSLLLLLNVVVARTVGWCLLGMAAGVCPGLVGGSGIRTRQGALGGAVGGAVGGLFFDFLGTLSATGSPSRAFGLITMGAMVGLAVALVEELAKQCWVVHLSGAREGRACILTKPESSLGRDEIADIPLFGDFSIQKRHARLVRTADGAELHAMPGCSVVVDGQPGTAFALHEGALITIGKHRLRFHLRGGVRGREGYAAPPGPLAPPGVHRLDVIGGPHQGQGFWLEGDLLTIGRAATASLPLVRDTMASREHARFVRNEHGWRVEDLGSTNGLYVNGERVGVHWLRPGDQVTVGQTVLRVA